MSEMPLDEAMRKAREFGEREARIPSVSRALANEIERLTRKLAEARDGLRAVEVLIDESTGVYGLRLNGDLSPWSELRRSGRFREWLEDFDAALDAADQDFDAAIYAALDAADQPEVPR